MKLLGLVAQFQRFPGETLKLFSVSILHDEGRGQRLSLDHYDVNVSRRYGYLFDMCGSGWRSVHVDGLYFLRGAIPVVEQPCRLVDRREEPAFDGPLTAALRRVNRTRRLKRLPRQFRGHGGLWGWLQHEATAIESVYCSTCRDDFPADSHCEHIWWCEEACWWSTPSERCGCAVRDMCDGIELTDRAAFDPERPRITERRGWEY